MKRSGSLLRNHSSLMSGSPTGTTKVSRVTPWPASSCSTRLYTLYWHRHSPGPTLG